MNQESDGLNLNPGTTGGFIQHPLVFQQQQQQQQIQNNALYSINPIMVSGDNSSASPSMCITCSSSSSSSNNNNNNNPVVSVKPQKVSFLEYVEVSGSHVPLNHDHNPHHHLHQSGSTSSPICHSTSQQPSLPFHYEPLRPEQTSSPPTTISSSNNSSPLSPLVSLDQHHHHHGIRSISPYMAPKSSSPSIMTSMIPSSMNPSTLSPHLETSNTITTNVIYKPVRSLIQYWPEQLAQQQHIHCETRLSPHFEQQSDNSNCLLTNDDQSTNAQVARAQVQVQLPASQGSDNLISKSSSSDSDTNDSGTRLISDSLNDDIVSASINHHQLAHHSHHHVYLSNNQTTNSSCLVTSSTIDTILEQEPEMLSPQSPQQSQEEFNKIDLPNNNNDADLWIQVQGDMSKSLREKYLQNQSNLDTTLVNNNNCNNSINCSSKSNQKSSKNKKDSFRFRRIGCGKCGFRCPLSHRAKTCLWSIIVALLVIISIILLFIWLQHNGGWRRFFGYVSTQPRRYQFEQDPFWYHGTTIYEIFPASFKDTDGDGFGDLQGIIERAPYLRSLGISAVRLNSIFAAFDYPKYYDNVLNFYDVDPHLGNFASFFKMIEVLHSNQIRVILEINPTITSDEHPWSLNQTEEYEYFYAPPAAATTTSSSSSSKIYDENFVNIQNPFDHESIDSAQQQYQLMSINFEQEKFGGRHLNWSHEPVRTQILKVADFWLRHVDGLYLKNLEHIYVHSKNNSDNNLFVNSTKNNNSGINSVNNNINNSVGVDSMNREKILQEFLQRLRRISDYHEQLYAKNHQLSIDKVPKKILICSSKLVQQQLLSSSTMNKLRRRGLKLSSSSSLLLQNKKKKKRRQTYFSPSSSIHLQHSSQQQPNEYRPEFDELDLDEFDIISANSHIMLPSSLNSTDKSASNQITSNSKSSLKKHSTPMINTKSIYHYFDLVHFDLSLRSNHIDNIRDQVNFVFLNRPVDFPTIMWSIDGSGVGSQHQKRSRLANQLGGSKYSLASLFLLIMMPGTISLFYGDEIGLQNVYDFHTKKIYPGGHLCPMAWTSDSPNGNFSFPNQSHPWIPMHPDYMQINVEKRQQMVKIVSDLINFRLDYLYYDWEPPNTTITAISNQQISSSTNQNKFNNQNSVQQAHQKSKITFQQKPLNYLFHYIDQNVVVLEQYFDRINPAVSSSSSLINNDHNRNDLSSLLRFRYVVFVNLGNETVWKDFSDKFHFSLIQLATNLNRTSEFLIMKSLKLDPGEAMIVTVE